MYCGWLVENRSHVLARIFPRFPDVIAHHVTHAIMRKKETLEQYGLTDEVGVIVAEVYNDKIQAVIVEINGSTIRPDGGHYHITWSLDREAGAKPFDSNILIAESGFEPTMRIPVILKPFIG